MNKTLFLILLIFLGIFTIKAETIDVAPPQINSIELNNTSFSVGDQIKFKIDALDDVSGIESIHFEFWDVNNLHNTLSISIMEEFINGEKMYTGNIPNNVRDGEYYLSKVSIYDNVRNYSCYVIDGLPFTYDDCIIKNFNIPNIKVKVENVLSTPKLESLTYDKKINTGEKLVVTAKLTDGAEIEQVEIVFNNIGYRLNKIDKYTYSTEILVTKKENLKFDSFNINDVNNNYIQYLYESIYNNMPDQYHFISFPDGKYDVEVLGETLTKPPVLKNITFSSPSIKVPSYIYAYLDIESEDIDNLHVEIVIEQDNCTVNCGDISQADLYRDELGKYYFKILFDQYQPAGTYSVNSLKIVDSYKNESLYANWDSEFVDVLPIDRYSFEIVNDTNADVTTSNEAIDIIDKINKSNEGSIISIDTSKNSKIDQKIFDAIKGTNKTISLESNGIRWIFNGNDIKNSKTIDISSNITLARDYNKGNWDSKDNALIIDFKNNGVLPGKVLIRIKADWTFRDYLGDDSLTVYYMNKNKFDLIKDNVLVTNDGYYEFYIDHNSTYVLSNKKINSKLVVNDHSEKLNNNISSNESNKIDNENNINSNENNEDKNQNEINSNESSKLDSNINSNKNNSIKKDKFVKNKNNLYLYIGIVVAILILIVIIFIFIKNKKILVKGKKYVPKK